MMQKRKNNYDSPRDAKRDMTSLWQRIKRKTIGKTFIIAEVKFRKQS